VGRASGVTPDALPDGVRAALDRADALIATADASEDVLEALASVGAARVAELSEPGASGVVYTPFAVARQLVDLCEIGPEDTVSDPAVGCGVFLLAAGERMLGRGASVGRAADALHGADVDPVSVAVTRQVLTRWARWRSESAVEFPGIVTADALLDEVPSWPHAFDVVVGNPPFLGQLRSSTARSRSRAKSLRSRFGELAQGYVDESALFLARGAELLSPRGRLGLIVPSSLLGAASAEPVRQRLTRQSHLSAIWVGGSDVFADASVDVVAPILTRAAGASGEVRITDCQGGTFLASDPGDRWADAVASASGVPRVSLTGAPLGEMARVTADFRDAYYWIAERVSEQHETPDAPRLATVGLVDPLHFRHGHSSVRFAKRRYDAPVVPDASGGARYLTWRSKRLRPKLLVATQTKVLECVVDASGDVLPSTPLLVIEPTDASDVWRVAAALTSPALSAWAARQGSGTGLGQGTFRLRASQLADAPLPTDASAWDEGAQLARQLHSDGGEAPSMDGLYELGRIMNRAYAEADPDALLDWWMSRLPHRGRASA